VTDECAYSTDGMIMMVKNLSTWRKTYASMLRGQQLTTCTIAWPNLKMNEILTLMEGDKDLW
jgi:hypothetical protein